MVRCFVANEDSADSISATRSRVKYGLDDLEELSSLVFFEVDYFRNIYEA